MKPGSIVVAPAGAALFVWRLAKAFASRDRGTGITTHHVMSLVGGVLMFAGIWLYGAGRKRRL